MTPICKQGENQQKKYLGWIIGVSGALIALFWWPVTDRLDLPKMWIMVLASSATVFYAWVKVRNTSLSTITPLFVLMPVMAWIGAREGMSARVEGWAGWVAAVAFVTLAGKSQPKPISKSLFFAGVTVAIIAWLQALGLPLFNSGLSGFSGRKVVSTLGNPGHMGWWMASIIPWVLLELHESSVDNDGSHNSTKHNTIEVFSGFCLALIVGALVFSGSRVAWIGGLIAVVTIMWKLRGREARRFQVIAASGIALGLLGGVAVDAVLATSKLGQRVQEIGRSDSTARGRVYIWKVHISSLGELPLMGGGPESFQRTWPKYQEKYLRKNPKEERFRSDLRHAHADPIEVFYDFGILGLLLGIWVIFRLFRGPPNKEANKAPNKAPNISPDKEYIKIHIAAMSSGLALIICGLGAPVLFFAPTLFLGAVALGVSLGPGGDPYGKSNSETHDKQDSARKTHPGKTKSFDGQKSQSPHSRPSQRSDLRSTKGINRRTSVCMALLFLGLAVTMIPLTERLVSEIYRTEATTARGKGQPAQAAHLARRALRIDSRNPRAAMELGMAMENLQKPSEAYEAWKKAARDLPTHEVQDRIIDLMTRGLDHSIPGRR